ncbi:uncharacterized protein [Diabrotica undecimpunctata]|uniref:uncharacterized protein n=1 Tax=Diabrotica undecimpunctata TaxID=50387 RepID=UPI003B63234B
MKANTEKKFPPIDGGSSVIVPVPSLERGKGDQRNILGVVLDNTDGFYKVGTSSGILPQLFARNQIAPCKAMFMSNTDVPNTELALRTIVKKQSRFGGQGFIKCNCKKKCVDGKCHCRKNGLICNSKCHYSLDCLNK